MNTNRFCQAICSHLLLLLLAWASAVGAGAGKQAAPTPEGANAQTIAFGSCLRQWQDQSVWQSIAGLSPEAFVFLGDNVYTDVGDYLESPEPERIGSAYRDLATTGQFRSFLERAREQDIALYATWDDHDYGRNDGGADYPYRIQSKGYFLDFFNLDKTAVADPGAPGIYQSHRLHVGGLDVQLILLDTRSFRSPLQKDPAREACPPTHTVANRAPDATVLGEAQWQWLESQLRQPADLRIIASSIQVIPEEHCFEKWANFPRERQRLFELVKTTGAEGVVFISGDRHLAEISKLPAATLGYPLYEVTASGLNSAMGLKAALTREANRHRVDKTLYADNFGTINVRAENRGHMLDLRLYNADGELSREVSVKLAELAF